MMSRGFAVVCSILLRGTRSKVGLKPPPTIRSHLIFFLKFILLVKYS